MLQCCDLSRVMGTKTIQMNGLIDWFEKKQIPCFYKSVFGIECPGCGMQRAFVALLRGDFIVSLKLYPALLPTIVMLTLLSVHIIYPLKHGAKILLSLFVFNTVIIIISYIYKLIV